MRFETFSFGGAVLLEIIDHVYSVNLICACGFIKRGDCCLLKPICGIPRVHDGLLHNTMTNGILIYVIESGQIRILVRDMTIPRLPPDAPIGRIIPSIDIFCFHDMQMRDISGKILRILRRSGNKMIMVCKHCPSLQIPMIFGC